MANEWMNYVDDDEEWLRKQLEQRRQQLFAPRHRDPRRETPTPAPYTPSPTMDIGMLPYYPTAGDVKNMAGPLPGRFLAPPRILREGPGYDPKGRTKATIPINPDDPNIELWQSIDEGRRLSGPMPGKFLGPLAVSYTHLTLPTILLV